MALMRPGRADITATRSARYTASCTSWVTKITVFGVRCQMLSSSDCMRPRVWASSAPNGSSISRIFGSKAGERSALAHPARKLRRIAVIEDAQPDQIDEGLRPLLASLAREAHALQAVE